MAWAEVVTIDWNEFEKSGDDHESLGCTGRQFIDKKPHWIYTYFCRDGMIISWNGIQKNMVVWRCCMYRLNIFGCRILFSSTSTSDKKNRTRALWQETRKIIIISLMLLNSVKKVNYATTENLRRYLWNKLCCRDSQKNLIHWSVAIKKIFTEI